MTADALEDLAHDVRLAEAADRARAGDFTGALAVLDLVPADHPDRLDLTARVHAQRGAFAEAEAAWREVLRLRPDDPAASHGCALIGRITAGRRSRRPVPRTGVAAAVAVLAVALWWPPVEVTVDHGLRPPPVVAVRPTPVEDPVDVLARALTTPDVVAERRAGGVRVTFGEGLFGPDATEPTPRGRQVLERWAAMLVGQDVRVTVLGHAVVVPGGPASGGSPVALARAGAAAEVLAAAGGLPLTAFTLASADQTEAPHHDPARDRTITLLVAR
ncbi:tetratricopeptide repeat protein [Saccharothrix sp. S26]|uniref:tetratricopeptide repeat protein n=1 Tax=Saccharothrix sp. S26 TaxID=2907215 RepID=UPI001F299F42|nr:tetratricopeptide repeat protein [Saccharothrix sp. S26]MCE6996032.1 tetratricopeptide repeat protein [Saccharothrix sp. S26]